MTLVTTISSLGDLCGSHDAADSNSGRMAGPLARTTSSYRCIGGRNIFLPDVPYRSSM